MNEEEEKIEEENDQELKKYYEYINYLKSIVNSLVIQNLANGNIPKVRVGIPMEVESLIQLKEEIEFQISKTLKHKSSIPESQTKQSS